MILHNLVQHMQSTNIDLYADNHTCDIFPKIASVLMDYPVRCTVTKVVLAPWYSSIASEIIDGVYDYNAKGLNPSASTPV